MRFPLCARQPLSDFGRHRYGAAGPAASIGPAARIGSPPGLEQQKHNSARGCPDYRERRIRHEVHSPKHSHGCSAKERPE
jgi:hypothetical protein